MEAGVKGMGVYVVVVVLRAVWMSDLVEEAGTGMAGTGT